MKTIELNDRELSLIQESLEMLAYYIQADVSSSNEMAEHSGVAARVFDKSVNKREAVEDLQEKLGAK